MTVYQWTNYDRFKSEVNTVRDYYDAVHRCYQLALTSLLPQPCDSALDIACGHGESTKLLRDHARQIVGVDSSSDLINIAQDQADGTDICYQCTTFECYEAAEASFDLVTAAWFWNHVHDEASVVSLAEKIHGHLRPTGCVAFIVPGDAFTSRRTQEIARRDFQWHQAWTRETPESTEGIFSYDSADLSDATWIHTKVWQPFYLMRLLGEWFDLSTWDVKGTLIREHRMPGLVAEPPFEIIYGTAK